MMHLCSRCCSAARCHGLAGTRTLPYSHSSCVAGPGPVCYSHIFCSSLDWDQTDEGRGAAASLTVSYVCTGRAVNNDANVLSLNILMRCKTSVHESVTCTSNRKLFALLLEQRFSVLCFLFSSFLCVGRPACFSRFTRRRRLEIVMMLFVNCILEVIFVYVISHFTNNNPTAWPCLFLFFFTVYV